MALPRTSPLSVRGEALSPRAAALYDTYLVGAGMMSAANASAAALIGTAALPNSCSGYTSQSYGACPVGKECKSTYKPGDDVCG